MNLKGECAGTEFFLSAGGALPRLRFFLYANPDPDSGDIKAKLGGFIGKKLVFELHNGKIAKGILLKFDQRQSADDSSVTFQNALGTFRIGMKYIRNIYFLKDPEKEIPDDSDGPPAAVQGTTDLDADYAEKEKKIRILFGLGYLYPVGWHSQTASLVAYPWPGADVSLNDKIPVGIRGDVRFNLEQVRTLALEGHYEFVRSQYAIFPGQADAAYLSRIDITSTIERARALARIMPGWQWRGVEFMGRVGIWSENQKIQTGPAYNNAVFQKDESGIALGLGAASPLLFRRLKIEIWNHFYPGFGYLSANTDTIDHLILGYWLQAGLELRVFGPLRIRLGYDFSYRSFIDQKSFAFNVPVNAGNRESWQQIYLAVAYALYWRELPAPLQPPASAQKKAAP